MENEDFSDEDQCQCMYTWEFIAHIHYSIKKTITWKMSTNQTHVFKYFHPSFLLSLIKTVLLFYILKVLKSLRLRRFVKTKCEERQWNGWKYSRWEFSGWKVSGGGYFQGGSFMGGNFSNGNSHEGIFLGPFSSYNVSIVIFQKIIYKYNKTLKKIYTLNS